MGEFGDIFQIFYMELPGKFVLRIAKPSSDLINHCTPQFIHRAAVAAYAWTLDADISRRREISSCDDSSAWQ